MDNVEEVYQLAADMGGAGYIFTGEHDADVMHNSATINLNMLEVGRKAGVKKFLLLVLGLHLSRVQPARPGQSQVLRRHPPIPPRPTANTAGRSSSASGSTAPTPATTACRSASPASTTSSGPKAPGTAAARKLPPRSAAKSPKLPHGGEIEIWGDGKQTRSFLYIDECVEGVRRLMESDFAGPVNIGSEEMVTINQLAEMVMQIAGKKRRASATSPAPSACAAATPTTG